MNKRGFIRTLEAIIAIIIVFVFIYTISQRSFEKANAGKESIKSLQEEILRGISEDSDYRNCVVKLEEECLGRDLNKGFGEGCSIESKECLVGIRGYAEENLGRFEDSYALVICGMSNCGIPELPDKNVYTSAIVIVGSLEDGEYGPRIVTLWVW